MPHQTIWQWLIAALQRNQPAALLVVVSSTGSSPGRAGNKMALAVDGAKFGTVGGGQVEHDLSVHAINCLNRPVQGVELISKQHRPSAEAANASGHICGGEQWLALLPCGPGQLPLFQRLQMAYEQQQPLLLQLDPQGLILIESGTHKATPVFHYRHENDWCYQETIGQRKTAYIIGGGHVGLALSKILATLGYDINVIDERQGLDTLNRNTDAHRKLIIPYRDISQVVPEGDQVFVFIMTHSHKTDEQVVEQLATKKVAYLGLLGSRRKIAQLKSNLSSRLPPEALQNIHAPIGLPIHSHTPAEIAVSIAAELIQLSNSV